ncbi:unnamed protein product [Ranitomeya imitator]|uniref:Uncharacterized protein n=1 Tax=Ranitomeya imitator TaxID=111125 RepID=A0ABN9LS82_9NEOB|nr:unnamed protein product [Ranitomeya imitator]
MMCKPEIAKGSGEHESVGVHHRLSSRSGRVSTWVTESAMVMASEIRFCRKFQHNPPGEIGDRSLLSQEKYINTWLSQVLITHRYEVQDELGAAAIGEDSCCSSRQIQGLWEKGESMAALRERVSSCRLALVTWDGGCAPGDLQTFVSRVQAAVAPGGRVSVENVERLVTCK